MPATRPRSISRPNCAGSAIASVSQQLRARAGGSHAGRSAASAAPCVLAVAAILVVVFVLPFVWDAWREWRQPAAMQGEVRLAVLFDDSSLPPPDRERLTGLLDYVVIRLADLNGFRTSFSVVPASELRETMVRGPGDAGRRVGATLAVSLALHRADRALVVSATLEDTDPPRVLGGDQKSFPFDGFSADDAGDLIVDILRIELQSQERSEWVTGTSGVAEARTLFAKGLTQTPYQTAQSALERHDQEKSLQTAIDYFNRAIELDPPYADAYARLGEAYLLLYRLTRRLEHITLAAQNSAKARELDDTRPSTWITLGMIDAQRGAYADAQRSFRNAIDRGQPGLSGARARAAARREEQRCGGQFPQGGRTGFRDLDESQRARRVPVDVEALRRGGAGVSAGDAQGAGQRAGLVEPRRAVLLPAEIRRGGENARAGDRAVRVRACAVEPGDDQVPRPPGLHPGGANPRARGQGVAT